MHPSLAPVSWLPRFIARRRRRPIAERGGVTRKARGQLEGEDHVGPINRIVASVAVTYRQHRGQHRDAFLLIGRVLLGWLFLVSAAGAGASLEHRRLRGLPEESGQCRLPSSGPGSAPGRVLDRRRPSFSGSPRAMPRWSAHYSSSLRPRWRIAIGSIRPRRWRTSTTISSRISRSSAARCVVRGRAGPLQHRSDAVEERLITAGRGVSSTTLAGEARALAPAPRALPT